MIDRKALSRWEGEGGGLGFAESPDDSLNDSELRLLARIGYATLRKWAKLPDSLREELLASICRPLVPGDRARAKARLAVFVQDNTNR